MTPSSRSTGAGATPLGPAISSRPWNARVSPRRHRRRRRGATPPGPPPHRPTRATGRSPVVGGRHVRHPSPHARNGPILPPRSRRWRMAHLLHQVLTTRSRERGPGRRGPCWPRLGARPPVSGVQLASYAGPAPVTRRSAPPSGASTSPTAAIRGLSAPCSCPPSHRCAPTPSPGLTTSANATKAKRLGPGRPALAHRRILTLHAMIPNDAHATHNQPRNYL